MRATLFAIALLIAQATAGAAQTTVYHLHNADSGDFCCRAMTTSGPAATGTALQSVDLKNQTGSGLLWNFQTPAGTGLGGSIPSGATVSFSLWMKKTADWGVILPTATLQLNGSTTICSSSGPALEKSPGGPVQFNCAIGASAIAQATTDKLTLRLGYSLSTPPGNHSVKIELDIDGTTDSITTVPNPVPPQITSVSPASGPVNWPVTVGGTNFGSSQGTSTLTFNGTPVAAAGTTWSDTSISTTVPAGATSGPVVVNVGGANSTCSGNCTFTVVPPPALTSVSPQAAHVGDTVTIAGTHFLAAQGSSTITFSNNVLASPADTTWSDTSIVTKVPAGAVSGPLVVTVSGQSSNALSFTVIVPGTISGTITRTADSAPLQGATVQAVLTGIIKASATTPADGTYAISGLDPGTYDLRVLATGYSSEVRSATVTSNTTSTVSVAMSQPGSIGGQVTTGGATPLPGAAVTMFLNGLQNGTVNTDGSGNYSITGLHPGAYTLQVVDVGYRTSEQGVVVNENANTSANVDLVTASGGPVLYAYDALGRLIQVTDPSGDTAIYRYDPVGNITAIERTGTSLVSISGFTPVSGAEGSTVTIYGTGFSATAGENTVLFNGTTASVSSSTATQIVVTVPAGATTGAVSVTAPPGSATSASSFTVTAAPAAPTITSFTPALVAPGDALNVTGTNFDATPANDHLNVNLASAQVSSASATSLQAPVPVTTTGHVSIATENGSATSTDYLWVAPPPYTTGQIESTGVVSFGTAATIPVNASGNVAIRAFEGVQGHRASVSLTGGTFSSGGSMVIYSVYGSPSLTGFSGTGFLEPVALTATGTYTLLLAPNSPSTGSATLTVYDVPADQTGPIVRGGSVPVSLSGPGQNARLSFVAAAGDRVCATMTSTSIATGHFQVLRPDTTPIKTVLFNTSTPGFLDTMSLATAGTYALFVDPDTTNTGDGSAALYAVDADSTGSITINDPDPVAVPLGICQNGSLTGTGIAGQQVTVHVTSNPVGAVLVRLLSSDGTELARALSSANSFNLTAATLPGTSPDPAAFTITIDPSTTNHGTLSISISGS